MLKLETTHPDIYELFEKRYHTIRRSDRLWAGLSPELVIEQVLMRSIKTVGGLTRGRGMNDLQRSIWLLPHKLQLKLTELCQNSPTLHMQQMTNIKKSPI